MKEGEKGSALCTVKSGDSPFDFEWKKDGNTLEVSSNIAIQSVLDSSVLVIQSVTSESSGNYTCVAKNAFGSDRFTAALTVTGISLKILMLYYNKNILVCRFFFCSNSL